MEVIDLALAGLKLIKPRVFQDDRGFFLESWRPEALASRGVEVAFVQDNHSRSGRHTVRGLHFQRASARGPGQAKLVRVARGAVLDVVVDIRAGSPTFGRWHAELLDDINHHQLFVPVGFAHGFCVTSEVADVLYKVSSPYDPATESGFAFDDPEVGVPWPVSRALALLSERDTHAPTLSQLFMRDR